MIIRIPELIGINCTNNTYWFVWFATWFTFTYFFFASSVTITWFLPDNYDHIKDNLYKYVYHWYRLNTPNNEFDIGSEWMQIAAIFFLLFFDWYYNSFLNDNICLFYTSPSASFFISSFFSLSWKWENKWLTIQNVLLWMTYHYQQYDLSPFCFCCLVWININITSGSCKFIGTNPKLYILICTSNSLIYTLWMINW